jgi:hypothetical protein
MPPYSMKIRLAILKLLQTDTRPWQASKQASCLTYRRIRAKGFLAVYKEALTREQCTAPTCHCALAAALYTEAANGWNHARADLTFENTHTLDISLKSSGSLENIAIIIINCLC